MAVSKDDLLEGTEKTVSYQPDGIDEEVEIRPLSYKEEKEVEAVQMANLDFGGIDAAEIQDKLEDIKNGRDLDEIPDEELGQALMPSLNAMDIDLQDSIENEMESNLLICAYGLSTDDEEWTTDEAGQLPKVTVEDIANKVWEMTQVEDEDQDVEGDSDEKNGESLNG